MLPVLIRACQAACAFNDAFNDAFLYKQVIEKEKSYLPLFVNIKRTSIYNKIIITIIIIIMIIIIIIIMTEIQFLERIK